MQAIALTLEAGLSFSAALLSCVAMVMAWQRYAFAAETAFATSKAAHAPKPRVDVNPGHRTWRPPV